MEYHLTMVIIDTAAWSFLQRAADLSSAAYTGCLGTAFDVTITKQIYDAATNAKVETTKD